MICPAILSNIHLHGFSAPNGPKNFAILTHLHMKNVISYIRTGSEHFYIVSDNKTAKQSVIARRYIDITGCSLVRICHEIISGINWLLQFLRRLCR